MAASGTLVLLVHFITSAFPCRVGKRFSVLGRNKQRVEKVPDESTIWHCRFKVHIYQVTVNLWFKSHMDKEWRRNTPVFTC